MQSKPLFNRHWHICPTFSCLHDTPLRIYLKARGQRHWMEVVDPLINAYWVLLLFDLGGNGNVVTYHPA